MMHIYSRNYDVGIGTKKYIIYIADLKTYSLPSVVKKNVYPMIDQYLRSLGRSFPITHQTSHEALAELADPQKACDRWLPLWTLASHKYKPASHQISSFGEWL